MIAASASSIWANAVGGILPQAASLEMAPAYLRDGDGEGKLHSGSGTGSVDVDSGFSPKAIELLERSGKWSRYTESPGGFIHVVVIYIDSFTLATCHPPLYHFRRISRLFMYITA